MGSDRDQLLFHSIAAKPPVFRPLIFFFNFVARLIGIRSRLPIEIQQRKRRGQTSAFRAIQQQLCD